MSQYAMVLVNSALGRTPFLPGTRFTWSSGLAFWDALGLLLALLEGRLATEFLDSLAMLLVAASAPPPAATADCPCRRQQRMSL